MVTGTPGAAFKRFPCKELVLIHQGFLRALLQPRFKRAYQLHEIPVKLKKEPAWITESAGLTRSLRVAEYQKILRAGHADIADPAFLLHLFHGARAGTRHDTF